MKRSILLLLTLSLLLALCISVGAASPRIVDLAQLLTASEAAELEQQAGALSREFQTDVIILTVLTTDGKDAQAYADDYFDNHGYGLGASRSGVLLLLVMDTRDWVISTSGDAMHLLSQRDCDEIFSYAADDISAARYGEGFARYLSALARSLSEPHDESLSVGTCILIAVCIGLIAGGTVLGILISTMRTARPKRSATDYLQQNSFRMPQCRDLYLYSTTRRVRIESNGSSSGAHTASSGRSHGGSRGKF